jgi:hypothetical protein
LKLFCRAGDVAQGVELLKEKIMFVAEFQIYDPFLKPRKLIFLVRKRNFKKVQILQNVIGWWPGRNPCFVRD